MFLKIVIFSHCIIKIEHIYKSLWLLFKHVVIQSIYRYIIINVSIIKNFKDIEKGIFVYSLE